ncbi:MAG TPA: hypothetical protein VJ608_13135, partial [Albitalea sp.]|nr:hypothetical protein [Albitalea sp.]
MFLRSSHRLALWRLAGALASLCLAGAAAADTTGHPIKDPHYGDVLFHFYQEHYFTSVTTLMASQHF